MALAWSTEPAGPAPSTIPLALAPDPEDVEALLRAIRIRASASR